MLCNYCQEITAQMGGSGSIVLRLKPHGPLWLIRDPRGHLQPGWPLGQVTTHNPIGKGHHCGEWLLPEGGDARLLRFMASCQLNRAAQQFCGSRPNVLEASLWGGFPAQPALMFWIHSHAGSAPVQCRRRPQQTRCPVSSGV